MYVSLFWLGRCWLLLLSLLLLLQLLLHKLKFYYSYLFKKNPGLHSIFIQLFFSLISAIPSLLHIHNMPTYIKLLLRNVHIFKTSHPCN